MALRTQLTGCYSSETSVTITYDADIESEPNQQPIVCENWRARMLSERRSSFTLKLSQLETESCHDRVIQWFERSTPDDDDVTFCFDATTSRQVEICTGNKNSNSTT
ncbi:uncharacterized protein LOC121390286 [Gigantopelta aegis]|uniref:uncharacterized protein LOC121390286 n=1 Tax=Gigantopelta aegis TaxID=1735272 RepID=UPI001B889CD2|nr:uncharacterized protein LOC121390286 [Gigantopelta aegis]